MVEPLIPRGPDAVGRFIENGLGLVHTRLSIMDPEPRSNQPMSGERWTLVYNGEIYNFIALREQLRAAGCRFETTGDTEVLLQAIETWGIDRTLDALIGMFAFAAYDRQAKELHLARDPFGMKPLYMAKGPHDVVFSSWPSSMLALSRRRWTLDGDGLWEYFLLGHPFSGRTLVREIEEIAPGEHVVISRHKKTRRLFWSVSTTSGPYREDEFFALFEEVVTDHARSDAASALFLSGGVDSSALALANLGVEPFHLRSDEERYARIVAEHVGQSLQVHAPGGADETDGMIADLTRQTGVAYFSPIQPLVISKAMAEAGYKVAFSANGGDELYLGYPRIAAPGVMPDLSALPFERPCAQDFEAQIRHMLRSPETIEVLDCDTNRTAERAATFLSDTRARLQQTAIPAAALYRWYEIDLSVRHNLNPVTDACGMLFGLEVRTPFIDRRLVEHALSLPTEVLITSSDGRKAPLKSYLRARGLPDSVFLRPKMGFSLSTEDSLRQRDARLAALARLSDLGLMRFRPSTGLLARDFAYVAAASQAFLAWYDAFVATGRVSV